MTNKLIFLLTLLLMVIGSVSYSMAQSLYYDIVKGDKNVGHMTIDKVINDRKMTYQISSRTELRIVFMIRVNYDLVEYYEDGILVGGQSKSTLNGALQKETMIRKFPDRYEFELASDLVILDQDSINYSIPEIYFSKPLGDTTVFSQVFAEYLEYKKVNKDTWILYSEDGKNTSVYDNVGICEMVKISRPYANFNLVLNRKKSTIDIKSGK